MTKYPKFVIRKIRNGRAKIFGRWFYPSNKWMEYDGRLDGFLYAFGTYTTGGVLEDFVCLWGTEEMYRAEGAPYGPELVDGSFPWDLWVLRKEIGND